LRGSLLQIGSAVLLTVIRLVFHAHFEPYKDPVDNLFDYLTLTISALTGLSGLLLQVMISTIYVKSLCPTLSRSLSPPRRLLHPPSSPRPIPETFARAGHGRVQQPASHTFGTTWHDNISIVLASTGHTYQYRALYALLVQL
jgi:hypothetical protein